MRIRTDYWAKCIDRPHDWSAVDADSYAGRVTDPVGYGATKAAAIAELIRLLGEEAARSATQ